MLLAYEEDLFALITGDCLAILPGIVGPTIGVFPGVFLLLYFLEAAVVGVFVDAFIDEGEVEESSGEDDFFSFTGDLASRAGDVSGLKKLEECC